MTLFIPDRVNFQHEAQMILNHTFLCSFCSKFHSLHSLV